MSHSLTRACLVLIAAAVAAPAGGNPPPEPPKKRDPRPDYTAFPDIKPPEYVKKEVKNPDGTTRIVVEEKGAVPLPPFPKLAADAPPLRRVKLEQLHAGLDYIERVREVIRVGNWSPQYFEDYMNMLSEVYLVAAELEEEPAKRVPWYEARVRAFKEMEQFTRTRVNLGTDPPQRLHQVQFHRLQVEAELLKLKDEVEKVKK